ncbi:hypothetical protein KFL_004160150 [Klebsormidium nitens]|uniref:SMODS and SLOG-associating 2TM effector domain-containing protein n=1 Tax=Klebsormidium nitens TaxID=105231 RepID=A0A1Y1IEB0_KLENI|nr:hypothetical protein KFL_004160150 [Klebsormidium nitens]|eukprot:GAQ88302.1 hypothetical protein KFL_004160150 [Klebsormidium nitens]
MGPEKALKQPLLEKANGKDVDDEQEVKKVTKKSKTGKSVKKAAADEQEVADVEQGATEDVEEAKPAKKAPAQKAAAPEVEEEPAAQAKEPVKAAGKPKAELKREFKAAGDVALLAASPQLEHQPSRDWSEKNEKVLQDWKLEVATKIKDCDAQARQQGTLGRALVIPATILGAMTTASSSLSALVKDTPALSYAAAAMSLVLTILTALHTSLNPEKQVQTYLTAKDKYVTVKNKIEATLAIDVEQRGDTGAHFILEIQGLLDKADDSINQIQGGH